MSKKIKNEKENLKGKSPAELKKQLADLQESIRVLRFKGQGSKSKNVKESGATRKQIARILTEMNSGNKKGTTSLTPHRNI